MSYIDPFSMQNVVETIGYDLQDNVSIVDYVSDFSEIKSIKQAWLSLEQKSESLCYFQSFAFCSLWFEHFCTDQTGHKPHIILIYGKREEIIAILPMVKVKKHGLIYLEIAGAPVSQYSDLIYDPSACMVKIEKALMSHWKNVNADVIDMANVRGDSKLYSLLSSFMKILPNGRHTYQCDLSSYSDFAAYFDDRSKAGRKNLRRKQRSLESNGKLQTIWHQGGGETESHLKTALADKKEWMAAFGKISRMFQCDHSQKFLLALAQIPSEQSGFYIIETKIGDQTIAYQCDFLFNGHYYAFLIATDKEMHARGAGSVAMLDNIRMLYDRGSVKTLDLLPPADDYKTLWGKEMIAVDNFQLYNTWKGRVIAGLFSNMKPVLKALFYRIPDPIRHKIIALVK